MTDIDPRVRVRIVPAGEDVIVEALASDGRSALRRVHEPSALSHRIEALMLVPAFPALPGPDSASERPAQSSGGRPEASPPGAAWAGAFPVRMELAAALTGRISRAPTYYSAGFALQAGIRTGAWLVAFSLRWEPFHHVLASVPPDFEMDTIGAGFLVSRELWRSDQAQLELGISALATAEIESYYEGRFERTYSAADLRVGAFARWLFGRGPLRWTAGLELDASPLRVRHAARSDALLPTLPSWGVGLALGAAWSGS